MNLLGHIERWLRRHKDEFAELPAMHIPAVADDEEVEVWNDHRYMRDLLDAILDTAHETESAWATQVLAFVLAAPTLDDQSRPEPIKLDGLLDISADLAQWAEQLDVERDAIEWLLGEWRNEAVAS